MDTGFRSNSCHWMAFSRDMVQPLVCLTRLHWMYRIACLAAVWSEEFLETRLEWVESVKYRSICLNRSSVGSSRIGTDMGRFNDPNRKAGLSALCSPSIDDMPPRMHPTLGIRLRCPSDRPCPRVEPIIRYNLTQPGAHYVSSATHNIHHPPRSCLRWQQDFASV